MQLLEAEGTLVAEAEGAAAEPPQQRGDLARAWQEDEYGVRVAVAVAFAAAFTASTAAAAATAAQPPLPLPLLLLLLLRAPLLLALPAATADVLQQCLDELIVRLAIARGVHAALAPARWSAAGRAGLRDAVEHGVHQQLGRGVDGDARRLRRVQGHCRYLRLCHHAHRGGGGRGGSGVVVIVLLVAADAECGDCLVVVVVVVVRCIISTIAATAAAAPVERIAIAAASAASAAIAAASAATRSRARQQLQAGRRLLGGLRAAAQRRERRRHPRRRRRRRLRRLAPPRCSEQRVRPGLVVNAHTLLLRELPPQRVGPIEVAAALGDDTLQEQRVDARLLLGADGHGAIVTALVVVLRGHCTLPALPLPLPALPAASSRGIFRRRHPAVARRLLVKRRPHGRQVLPSVLVGGAVARGLHDILQVVLAHGEETPGDVDQWRRPA